MKKTLLFFFVFISISCFAQLSNKHWIPPLHSRTASQISDHYIYLSTAEANPFLVYATDGAGNPYIGSPYPLSASNPVIIPIGIVQPSKMFLSLDDVNIVVSDKGILLDGSKEFYASFRMRNTSHSETIISKGRTGIGTSFRLGCTINESTDNRKNFVASVIATKDSTNITLSDYDTGVVFASGSGNITSDTQTFSNLKAGESIVFSGYSNTSANLTGIIGALITSNYPIAVNTGNAFGGISSGADLTLDQIVSVSKVGKKYIFIEGNGSPTIETPLIVGTANNTTIKINGVTVPGVIINAGGPTGFYQIPNSYYVGSTHRNMYIETSEPVYAYQSLGGGTGNQTMGLNFIPPLSCFFQKSVNIPKVNEIGSSTYTSDLMILTSTEATITLNGNTIATSQALQVIGNTDWVTYRIPNVTGDANVVSTGPLAVGVFGSDGSNSGFAGYYSGFGSTPEDTNITVCSNATQNLFDIINGNPDTGGTWTVPSSGSPLAGNVFDPNINSPGDYIYSFPNCDVALPQITIKVNVIVQQSKNAGVSNSTSSCVTTPSYDLFPLLGTTADVGGTWSPALSSGTGIFNPAVDVSGIYTYSFPVVGSCAVASAFITVDNSAVPILNTITDFKKCDDTIDGNDTNSFVDFDLTSKNSEILGTQTGINVTYHILQSDAESGINPITTLYSTNRIVYARLTNAVSGCNVVTSFKLTVNPLPIINNATIIQCDDDLDAVSSFNLTVKNDVISNNSINETFTYYTSWAGANTADAAQLITTPFAFTNTTAGTMPVWARVANNNGCFRIAKLTLQVLATNIPSTYNIQMQPVCDDLLDANGINNANNNKRDGIATFNFSATKATIQNLLPTTAGVVYNVNYYRNQADALAELNVIADISNYRNIGYPNNQNIWVRVDSDADNACYGLGPFVTLTIEKLPFANHVSLPRQCDDNQDGIFTFNTAALETTLLGTNQTFPVTVTYSDAVNNPLKDANGVLITSPFPATFTTASQTIKAVVTNNTAQKCFDETTIQFIVDDLPEAFAVSVSLTTTCDDELDPLTQDGKFAFDTSSFQSTILGTQTGMTVKYFDGNGNSLPSPLPNPFVTATQNVKVVVENPINPTCTDSIDIPFIVQPLPNINLNTNGSEDELVCSNLPTFFVQLNAGIQDGSPTSNYTYIWSKDGTVLSGQVGYTLDVNAEGIYTVEVTNASGCSRIRTLKVTASDIAVIQTVDVVDMADANTVTINVTGAGDYEYSLDEASGYFQDSNFFTNVPAGIHEVFINDKNGCGAISRAIAVVGLPKFFTPNNDGYNDYWNVKGVNATFNANSIIYIFDRYGKLLKQLQPSSEGWDGTFNGTPLASDDYWYTVKLEDGRETKGHFSLKR
jgi:gliding motility-associated-like protein